MSSYMVWGGTTKSALIRNDLRFRNVEPYSVGGERPISITFVRFCTCSPLASNNYPIIRTSSFSLSILTPADVSNVNDNNGTEALRSLVTCIMSCPDMLS